MRKLLVLHYKFQFINFQYFKIDIIKARDACTHRQRLNLALVKGQLFGISDRRQEVSLINPFFIVWLTIVVAEHSFVVAKVTIVIAEHSFVVAEVTFVIALQHTVIVSNSFVIALFPFILVLLSFVITHLREVITCL